MSSTPPIRVRQRALSARATVASPLAAEAGAPAPGPSIAVTHTLIAAVRPTKQPLRKRGRGQIERLAANIERFGCLVPILVKASGEIIDGHAIYEACRRLNHASVPTIVIDHLADAEIKALRLSLNRIADKSSWDTGALAAEFADILAIEPDLIAFTGFDMPEVDLALTALSLGDTDPVDAVPEPPTVPVSRLGDLWTFAGGHRLLCGNARMGESYDTLLAGRRAQKLATDPPYGCAIRGYVSGSHGEFIEGSDMSEAGAEAFFADFFTAVTPHLEGGAIAEMFIDCRGMHLLMNAARGAGLTHLTTCVWDKGIGGMGSLYRQQVEFVLVMKRGTGRHINNVALGRHGRNRTTIWSAPGLNGFGHDRQEMLALHPTVKPVGLIVEALLDTSHRGGLVLDPFCGSGTTLLASHRTGRLGHGIELDPIYVDVAVRRMEALTGAPARHAETGLTFAQEAERRERDPSHHRAAAAASVSA